jgi:hypothetical protein
LAQIARRESEALELDASFAAELRELLALAADGSAGDEHDSRTALLLEGLLSELSARASKAGQDASEGVEESRSIRDIAAKASR